jgi:hypothetical protein
VSLPRLVLHIGMQQSGATMLQRTMARLRPQLHRLGVAYLGHTDIRALDHAAGWDTDATADPHLAAAFQRDLASAAEAERRTAEAVRGRPPGIVLLSSDHLVGRRNVGPADATGFRPRAVSAVDQVVRALGTGDTRLVLYTHRQDRLMELCYLREVQGGRHHRFDEQFPYLFEPVLDYADLVERLVAIPGVSGVTVRPVEPVYADPTAFVGDFLDVVGVEGQPDLDVVGRPSPHRVYSSRGLRLALGMNPFLDSDEDRRLVRTFLMENFAARHPRDSRFVPEHVRRRILHTYREPNRRLFSSYMPDLPEDGYDGDEATDRLGAVLASRFVAQDARERRAG